MISSMNRTTSNANPPPKFPFTPDMKFPPFEKETKAGGLVSHLHRQRIIAKKHPQ